MKIIVFIGILSVCVSSCKKRKKKANRDKIPPHVVCQNISVSLDQSGKAVITQAMINNGRTDNLTTKDELMLSLDNVYKRNQIGQ